MHQSPDQERLIHEEFSALVNLEPSELVAWLKTAASRKVGVVRRGETESIGRQSARKIIAIAKKSASELDEADYAHMRKVIGFCRRHLAQRPWGDMSATRWRWSLMNKGHDPLRGRRPTP